LTGGKLPAMVEGGEPHSGRAGAVVRWTVAFGLLAVAIWWIGGERHLLPDVWRQLRTAERGWLVALVGVVGLALVNLAMFHAAAQRAAGLATRRLDLIEPAMAANSLNMITKSGGLAGLAPMTAHARRTGRPIAAVVAAYLLVAVVGQWTFAVVLGVSLVLTWAGRNLTGPEVAASGLFAVLVAFQVVVFVATWRRSPLLERLLAAPTRLLARLRHRAVPASPPAQFDEFHASLTIVRERPGRCVPVILHGFAVEALGVVQLTVAVAATGQGVHVVAALVAYSVGLLFAIVGVVPGGVGLVEVTTTGVLVTFGIGVAPAAAAVVLFRVAELWLPVAVSGVAALGGRRSSVVT
jgi:uncharacterized protein (TIRG00374 family)